MDGCPDARSGGHSRRWPRVLPRRPAAPTAEADRRTSGREGHHIMSGKFCAVCLGKDAHLISLHRLADCCGESTVCLYNLDNSVQNPYFAVALISMISHNY